MSRAANALVASYRLQLTPEFGFDRVADLLEMIAGLGVSHLYLSPISEALPGSQHGYDVADHRFVRREFGGEEGLAALLDAAEAHDLGVVIDHVPNHVTVARAESNPHWWAMLRDGPDSEEARWFDVDWDLTDGKVIVPKLGEPLSDVLASGALVLADTDDGPELHYGPLRFPVTVGADTSDRRDVDLPELLAQQHYQLEWWRHPARNVRRFFTIDDLVAVRVEDEAVRSVVDTIPRALNDHPAFAGVRVDHVDGLADPLGYLRRLRTTIGDDRWLLVEKILGPGETLPADWPVDGTTGYEHITVVEHTMLDERSEPAFTAFWNTLTIPEARDFETVEDRSRREVVEQGLRPDLDRVVRAALADDESPFGAGIDEVRQAVVELTVGLHRYRTYLPDDAESQIVFEDLVERTAAAVPDIAAAVRWFGRLVLRAEDVRVRWQQLTGPAMAKGAEDRAFYRHQRLASLCEVGGRPGRWSFDVAGFHRHQQQVQERWPTTMLAATTHDTKRSSGVRARSLALTAEADDFVEIAGAWMRNHPDVISELRGGDVSLAVQTAVTAAPLDAHRLGSFLVKAAREADLDTGWAEPRTRYEERLEALAAVLVDDVASPGSPLAELAVRVRHRGASIGARLAVLQLTCPGVPDLYQGSPLELLYLVDPDNRRPPDWVRLQRLVETARAVEGPVVASSPGAEDDTFDIARIVATRRLLALRRRRPSAFGPNAGYRPVDVDGPAAGSVIAFERADSVERRGVAVTVALRAALSSDELEGTVVRLPDGRWRSLLADGPTRAGGGPIAVVDLVGALGVDVHERVGE